MQQVAGAIRERDSLLAQRISAMRAPGSRSATTQRHAQQQQRSTVRLQHNKPDCDACTIQMSSIASKVALPAVKADDGSPKAQGAPRVRGSASRIKRLPRS